MLASIRTRNPGSRTVLRYCISTSPSKFCIFVWRRRDDSMRVGPIGDMRVHQARHSVLTSQVVVDGEHDLWRVNTRDSLQHGKGPRKALRRKVQLPRATKEKCERDLIQMKIISHKRLPFLRVYLMRSSGFIVRSTRIVGCAAFELRATCYCPYCRPRWRNQSDSCL